MIKPRHLYEATEVEIEATDDGQALALTFRTTGDIDLTILAPSEVAYRLRDHIAFLSGK